MSQYKDTLSLGEELREKYPKLSVYESLMISAKIVQTEEITKILKAGLNVSSTDKHPPALEAIAIQLGYKVNGMGTTVIEAIESQS